jgi:CobQ-like glutamine amidotransferase family enzyme
MLGEPQQHNTTATQHKVDYVVHNIIVLSPNAWKTDIDVNVSPVPLDEETKAGAWGLVSGGGASWKFSAVSL